MITKELLAKYDYKVIPNEKLRMADICYQRVVWDFHREKKLYFIELYGYKNPDLEEMHWSAEVEFYLSDSSSFRITRHRPNTLFEIEMFFDSAYGSMGCVPDLCNND